MEISEKYINRLIGKVYVLLPSFEGRSHLTKEVIYEKEEAYSNFIKNLDKLRIEIIGLTRNFPEDIEYMAILNILEGLRSITIEDHETLKQNVFSIIDLCDKIKHRYIQTKETE